jgi:hypothetical protein
MGNPTDLVGDELFGGSLLIGLRSFGMSLCNLSHNVLITVIHFCIWFVYSCFFSRLPIPQYNDKLLQLFLKKK